MSVLLHIDSSPMGPASVSRRLTAEFARAWLAAHPRGRIIRRDLSAMSIPVIDAAWVAANYTPATARTPRQHDLLRLSAELTGELMDAGEYVIGLPVHNWGPAAAFKLWVDQIVTPFGPRLEGKRATFIIAAGRSFRPESGDVSRNHVEPWLRTLFGRLGVADLRFILVDGAADVQSGKIDLAAFLAPHIETIQAALRRAA